MKKKMNLNEHRQTNQTLQSVHKLLKTINTNK